MPADPPHPRDAAARRFLDAAGWGDARWQPLAGDASARSYRRLTRGMETAVLMDSPPGQADDPAAFVAIGAHLSAIGLSPPRVLAADLEDGFLLLEDLGDSLFARLAATEPEREPALYAAATDVLIHLQANPAPPGLPDLPAQDWAEAAMLAVDVYAAAATGSAPPRQNLAALLGEALATHADGPRVLILRDYHAENLLWLKDRPGVAAVGLLDFQLGQMGQPAYDLVSLLQDARRDPAPGIEAAMVARFRAAHGGGAGFEAAYAALGVQRALRIIGVFARLAVTAGKSGYLPLMPRVWGHLMQNLAHPALARLNAECARLLPPPTPTILARIAQSCPAR
ncbi:MAG: phosphotransferase [Paracoccaceae bacterium]|nr:MAG: phosphotransferase [Paracoccaceae bacterium]